MIARRMVRPAAFLFLASLIIDFKIKPAAPQSIFREKLDWS